MKEEKQNKMAIAPMNKILWKMVLLMIVSMANIGSKGALANQALTYAFPIQIMIIAVGILCSLHYYVMWLLLISSLRLVIFVFSITYLFTLSDMF